VLNKEDPIAIWMDGDNIVVNMNSALCFSKQLQEAHIALELPFFCIIVLKNPNGNSTLVKAFSFSISTDAIQVPLGLIKKKSTRATNPWPANDLARLPFQANPSYQIVSDVTMYDDKMQHAIDKGVAHKCGPNLMP
jgi:hypothetical protein